MKKVALITGVSSGIGKYICEKFVKKNIQVFGIDIEDNYNSNICFYKSDVSNEKEIQKVLNDISNKVDHIDYVINVAGIFCYKERNYIENLSFDEWKKVIDINLSGAFLISKYSIPLLKKSNNGNIILFSTEQVLSPQKKSAPYAVSKTGVEMLSKILAVELLEDKIRVNTISLASVKTNFIRKYKNDDKVFNKIMIDTNKKMPFGIIKTEDVYKLVNYLIDKSNKMTGQVLLIDSGVLTKNLIN